MTKAPVSRRFLDLAIEKLGDKYDGANRIRRVVANTIIGQLLPGGVVKGGSALKLRFGDFATRFTRDMDAAQAADLEDFIAKLDSALQGGWGGFTGHVVRGRPPHPKDVPESYVMKPFEVKLDYNNKPWVTVPLEMGHNEIGDADEAEYCISPDIVEMFEDLGLPKPGPIPLMPLHHQIAQKLHGLSDAIQSRPHDLIDLQLILAHANLDFAKIKDTCERLFKYRRAQEWPPSIVKKADWQLGYDSQKGTLPVRELDEAIVWVNELISRINV